MSGELVIHPGMKGGHVVTAVPVQVFACVEVSLRKSMSLCLHGQISIDERCIGANVIRDKM